MRLREIVVETTAGATASGSVASVAMPMGAMRKRGSLLASEQTNTVKGKKSKNVERRFKNSVGN